MLSYTKAPYKINFLWKTQRALNRPWAARTVWSLASCASQVQDVQGRPRLGAPDRVSACTEWPPLCELPPAVAPPTSAVSAVRTRLLENFFFSTASAPLCTAGGTAVQSGFGSGSEATPAVQSA